MACPHCGCGCSTGTDPIATKKDIEDLKKWFNTHINTTGPGPSGPPKVAQHEWTPRCASGECGKCRGSE